jgi:hypothetical protein
MNFLSCRLSRVLTVIIFSFFCVSGSSAPSEISSLAVAGGRLFAGTTSGKIFVSGDTGHQWSDISGGLCEATGPIYQRAIHCIKVAGHDSIHVITGCGEFVSALQEMRWARLSRDGCFSPWCAGCVTDMRYSASMHEVMIRSFITGPIEWSNDSGKTWTIAVPGCPPCSMPIVGCLYFDSISAFAGLSAGSQIGFNSDIIVSVDSGRTWKESNFSGTQVSSIMRIGSIAFVGTMKGLYASRDNFSTWWLIGESLIVRAREARIMAAGKSGRVIEYTLTGKKLPYVRNQQGMQAVLEARGDGKELRVKKSPFRRSLNRELE